MSVNFNKKEGNQMQHWSLTFIAVLPLALGACSTLAVGDTNTTAPEVKPDKSTIGYSTGNVKQTGDALQKGLTELFNCDGKLTYIPVPAFQTSNYTTVELEDGKPKVEVRSFPTDTDEINKLLPNLSMDVSSKEVSGGGKFLGFNTCLLYTSPSPRD